MSDVLTYQVVVSNGLVVATQAITDDCTALYGTSNTYQWFNYTLPLLTDSIITVTTLHSLDDTTPLPDPTTITNSDPTGLANSTTPPPTPFVATRTVTTTSRLASIPDPRLTMDLSDAQNAMISMLQSIYNHNITTSYPIQVQLDNLRGGSGYSSSTLSTMNAFLNAQETALATHIAAVNALGTVAAVIAYDPFV
jgi:hypothetical protein